MSEFIDKLYHIQFSFIEYILKRTVIEHTTLLIMGWCLSNNHIIAATNSSSSDVTPSSNQSLSVHFIISLFVFFVLCIVWPSIFDFCLPLWYLQTWLTPILYQAPCVLYGTSRLILTIWYMNIYSQSCILFLCYIQPANERNQIALLSHICKRDVNPFIRHKHFYTCKKYIASLWAHNWRLTYV